MGKFKIEKGVSRINRVKLQASIEEPVAAERMDQYCWGNGFSVREGHQTCNCRGHTD